MAAIYERCAVLGDHLHPSWLNERLIVNESHDSLIISADDLSVLKAARFKADQLVMKLGSLTFQQKKIEAEIEALMPQFPVADREFTHQFNRIRTKYGLTESAQISEAGEVS